MVVKKILSPELSRRIALETIAEIAGVVKQTLGPGGNPIIIQRIGNNLDGTPLKPIITKDGVSVAESIRFRDPAKDSIAQAILQVAQNTVNQAGDGTTTAIVLAEAIFKEGYKHIEQGTNGIALYNELKSLKDHTLSLIDKCKKDITEKDTLNVARVSSNGDEEVAKIVHDALLDVGEDGHISLEEGYSRDTTLKIIEGAMYKQGWRGFGPQAAWFVNQKARNSCELHNPAVLLHAGKLASIDDLGQFINKLMKADEAGVLHDIVPLLIVSHDYTDEVKNFILEAKIKQHLPIAAIKSPFDGSPNSRTEMLDDLAVLLGGKVAVPGILDLPDLEDEDLGNCEKVEVLAEEIAFYNGAGDPKDLLKRVEDLKQLKETIKYDFDSDNLNLRIGKLTGGIAIISVGGDTEIEMLEKKDRIEDALCAAKVAIQDGIVPGGGWLLYNISNSFSKEDSLAKAILREALKAPIKQIILNSGANPEVVLSHMEAGKGYDARAEEYCNLMEKGIVDPAKVTKSALENAVSIAGLLLTTGGAIVVDNESKDGTPNPLAGLGLV